MLNHILFFYEHAENPSLTQPIVLEGYMRKEMGISLNAIRMEIAIIGIPTT